MWEQSKYNVTEGDTNVIEVCAAPVGSLTDSVTVTDVRVEELTAGEDCPQ